MKSNLSKIKFKKILIILLILITLICVKSIIIFPLSSTTVKIENINYDSEKVTFTVRNLNSGCYISKFDYTIEHDKGIMHLKFYGSSLKFLSGHISDQKITIEENNIQKIIIE